MSKHGKLFRTLFLGASLLGLLAFGLSPALAQPPQPAGTAAACSPEKPCPLGTAVSTAPSGLSFAEAAAVGSRNVAVEPGSNGFWLAWIVMALLALALIYALVSAVLLVLGRSAPALAGVADVAIPVLAVLGMGVAIYLSFIEVRNVKAVCGPVGDCNAVQASPYAKLFGFLPVGVLGLAGYVAIIVAWGLGRYGKGTLARLAPLALLGMALFGVLFSIYLTYLELFVILAVCIWCLSSATIMALLLIVSVGPALAAIGGE